MDITRSRTEQGMVLVTKNGWSHVSLKEEPGKMATLVHVHGEKKRV